MASRALRRRARLPTRLAFRLRVASSPDRISAPVIAVLNPAPMAANESVPVVFCVLVRFVTTDVVTDGDGFFAIALAFKPDGDEASGVWKADLHCMGARYRKRALLDSSVFFGYRAVMGLHREECFFDCFE